MNAGEIERAADWLCRARLEGRSVAGMPAALRPEDEAAGYAVQEALSARLGAAAGLGPVVGFKIGCTTPVMQRYLAIPHPAGGAVYGRGVQRDRAALRHGTYVRPGAECEVAVRLERPLPAGGAPYDRAGVAEAVGACMAAIEVVDDRYGDFLAIGAPTLIADDFFHAGAVLGPEVAGWRDLDLAGVRGRMTVNGREAGAGTGAEVMGHPLEALAWLANTRAARGRDLPAGAIVLLGSLIRVQWVAAGDAVEIEIEGLGNAAVHFS
ncbi:MAG TPA: fumarylacetoacetate hydrolase family protein [Geminicoccaceae bacterium]|nr:fumarylacetoacetate hydrolase family protein [Geminicoccaceae bacterium]